MHVYVLIWVGGCVIRNYENFQYKYIYIQWKKTHTHSQTLTHTHIGFSRVYSKYCCSCSFEPEIIKIGQSSHKMYSNNILYFQESTTIFIACTKKSGNLLNAPRVYIYIYIYANFIKHNRHFMPTYFLLDPFEFPYYFYRIRGELIKVLSIVVCIPSTFCPTLGHHQGRICYKSDVTFVLANYYCVRTSLLLEIMALAFKCNSVNSASS